MNHYFPNMFKPIQIGTVTVPNRFVVPPMGNNFANPDGSMSDRSAAYYEARAKGGFGLITLESTVVYKEAKGGPRKPCLFDDAVIPSFKAVADRCHAYGAKVSIQLQHAGPEGNSKLTGYPLKAASAIAKEVRQRNIRISIIGIPKTIDNDINFVPQSFGFDTAVDKATEAIGCAHVEAVGTPNGIGIVKLMGRESGFIAAQSALALREANFVLIPEAPFQLHGDGGLLPALERRLKLRGHAVIIAAEGAGQHLLQQNEARDASGNPVLSDVGSLLRTSIVDYFHGKMPISIKYIDPSYIIRSVPANANDRVYCGFLGQHAVHAAMAGRTEMVVAKIMDRYVHIPLDLVTKKRRKLDIRSGLWRAVLESTGQGELTGMLPEGEKA